MGRAALLVLGCLLSFLSPGFACGPASPCAVPSGIYQVRPPAGWDGKRLLPVAVHFHGAWAKATDIMQDEKTAQIFSELGVLLVSVQGHNGMWRLPVFDDRGARAEYAFVGDVMADVARRFPIDRSRTLATGFSLGGSLVWYLACFAPERFTAYVPFSGAFWKEEPMTCPMGPVSLLHIHGTQDPVMPLAGRKLRDGLAQGNVATSLATLRKSQQCAANRHLDEHRTLPDATPVRCELDPTCDAGGRVEACFHDGGHYVAAEWYRTAWAFVEATRAEATKLAKPPPN